MKLSQEQQQAMYPTDQQIQDHQQSMVSPPGIVINDKEQYNCKMSQEAEDPHAINSHRNGHMGENGHQFSHLKQSVMSHHHLHRMEFNGSGGDSHSSQSSGTSNEYIHGHHERQMDPHPRVADMAYPMMNLEEFIHQQTAGFSDPDSGSDRSGHSDYSRGSGHYEKSNYGDNKGGVIHHHGKPLIQLSADFSPSDLALATSPDSQYHFDPSNATFNSDELKPQPIISKSRKTLVPEGMKDNRYVKQK